MTRSRARWRAHHIIGVFGQPRSRLGVAHELNTGLMQRLSDASASVRLALGGDDGHCLPIGDGVDIETGRCCQLDTRPAEQGARRADLAAHDNATELFAHAAILTAG